MGCLWEGATEGGGTLPNEGRSRALSVNQSIIGPKRRHLHLLNTEISGDPVVGYAEIDEASQFACSS